MEDNKTDFLIVSISQCEHCYLSRLSNMQLQVLALNMYQNIKQILLHQTLFSDKFQHFCNFLGLCLMSIGALVFQNLRKKMLVPGSKKQGLILRVCTTQIHITFITNGLASNTGNCKEHYITFDKSHNDIKVVLFQNYISPTLDFLNNE